MTELLSLLLVIYILRHYATFKENVGELLEDTVYILAFILLLPVRLYLKLRKTLKK